MSDDWNNDRKGGDDMKHRVLGIDEAALLSRVRRFYSRNNAFSFAKRTGRLVMLGSDPTGKTQYWAASPSDAFALVTLGYQYA